jgi:sugar phosphate isomerase/epimerase
MPTIALSTGSLYTYGIARVFELATEAGFDAIEVLADQRWDSRQPQYLRRLIQKTGLPVTAVHSPFSSVSTPGWPHDPVGRLRAAVALAQQVGARVVVAHLPLRVRVAKLQFLGGSGLLLPLPSFGERKYLQFLANELTHLEEAQTICIGVENMPARRFLGRRLAIHYLNNLEALCSLPHLTLDTTHAGTWGWDLLQVYEQLEDRIVHVHLSNYNGQEHRLLENGHLPLGELLQRLTNDSFRGTITVELNPDVLQAEDEAQVRLHLRRAVTFCREHTGSSRKNPPDKAEAAP